MIEVSNLVKRFGPVLAVDNVSFQVPANAVVGFLGPNGAGKTTTMRMLAGLLSPTSGTARIAGFDCLNDSLAVCKILGYILLHVKHAQGRAALASRLKRADDHILYGLLKQRRTVDDHCI